MEKVSCGTLVRTVVLLVALVNQILTMLDENPLPFSKEEAYAILTNAATIAATIWSWWKNNSFTKSAVKADAYLKRLKEGESHI